MGMIGAPEILLIGGIVVLLFGAKKIPELASGIGKGLKEFRKATSEATKELNEPEKSKGEQEKTKDFNEISKDSKQS
jgi:sec-independent protein translocase protein TatA